MSTFVIVKFSHFFNLRCLMVSQYCGLSWEADFWRVLNAVISTQRQIFVAKKTNENNADQGVTKANSTNISNHLDLKFDLACENYGYAKYQREKLSLHESKCRYESVSRKNESHLDIDTMVSFGSYLLSY